MKLHKNNGTHETYYRSDKGVLRGFRASDEWGEYLAGLPLEKALRRFILSAKGLASLFEEKEFEGLMQVAKEGVIE